jgi:hypothetical protein
MKSGRRGNLNDCVKSGIEIATTPIPSGFRNDKEF